MVLECALPKERKRRREWAKKLLGQVSASREDAGTTWFSLLRAVLWTFYFPCRSSSPRQLCSSTLRPQLTTAFSQASSLPRSESKVPCAFCTPSATVPLTCHHSPVPLPALVSALPPTSTLSQNPFPLTGMPCFLVCITGPGDGWAKRWLGIDVLGNSFKPREGEMVAGLTGWRGCGVREARGTVWDVGGGTWGNLKTLRLTALFWHRRAWNSPWRPFLGPQPSTWK